MHTHGLAKQNCVHGDKNPWGGGLHVWGSFVCLLSLKLVAFSEVRMSRTIEGTCWNHSAQSREGESRILHCILSLLSQENCPLSFPDSLTPPWGEDAVCPRPEAPPQSPCAVPFVPLWCEDAQEGRRPQRRPDVLAPWPWPWAVIFCCSQITPSNYSSQMNCNRSQVQNSHSK